MNPSEVPLWVSFLTVINGNDGVLSLEEHHRLSLFSTASVADGMS